MERKPITLTIIIVTALLYATQLSSCQPGKQILCVLNETDNATECSALTQVYNCTACQSLSSYTQNIGKYLTSNVEMLFTMGYHCFFPPPNGTTVFNVSGVANFTMKGLGNISYNPSEDGAIQPSSVITCSCSQNQSGILFYKSNGIHIESLAIEECGALAIFPTKTQFTLVSALIFYDSYNIKVIRIRANRNLGYGMVAERVFGNFTVSYSAFLRSVVYPLTLKGVKGYTPSYIGRNARFWYAIGDDVDIPSIIHNLLIEHSWFLYAGQNNISKQIQSSVGLSVIITLPNVSVLINHEKAMHNAGGNIAIRISDYHECTSSVTINNTTIAHGATKGGGLYIWIEIKQHQQNGSIIDVENFFNAVVILNTNFVNNSASKGGGAVFVSHFERSVASSIQWRISFIDCQFIGNSVIQSRSGDGGAVYIFKHDIADKTPHICGTMVFI